MQSLYSAFGKQQHLYQFTKEMDEKDGGDNRPLSLSSVLSKIMESEINDNLLGHTFTGNNCLFSHWQWAYTYRAGHSIDLLLMHLTENKKKHI